MTKQWSHQELVEKSVKWLRKALGQGGAGCHVAVSEFPTGWTGEVPDAIGFRAPSEVLGGSVVCEVKVSRSDFLVDAKKPHRNGEILGVGNHRFYVVPQGLIQIDELPPNWGLVEITERGAAKCIVGYPSTTHQGNRKALFNSSEFSVDVGREMNVLIRLLSRVGNVEELNNIKRENGRLNAENKALRDENEAFELAKYTKELADIRVSKIPIPRQIQRKKNQIARHQNEQEI